MTRRHRLLQAQHEPRVLKTADLIESRLSRADEQDMTDRVRLDESGHERDALLVDLEAVRSGLAAAGRLGERYSRVVAGDQRSALRALKFHARRLASVLEVLENGAR